MPLKEGHPHLGVVVLDSPLKAYSQKESADDADREISHSHCER
jgi:hypothetical protein